MVLIGVLSAIWLRLTGKPASLIRRTRSRGDTEPNSWPASEAWRSTVKLLPLSWSATPAASLFMAAERACSSAFMISNRVRFSSVARSALPRGNRKLRANPSLTRTVSPIWPRRGTRSSKITSMTISFSRFALIQRFGIGRRDAFGAQRKKALGRAGERQDRHDPLRFERTGQVQDEEQ